MAPLSVTLSDLETTFQGHGIVISVYAADALSVCDTKFLFYLIFALSFYCALLIAAAVVVYFVSSLHLLRCEYLCSCCFGFDCTFPVINAGRSYLVPVLLSSRKVLVPEHP